MLTAVILVVSGLIGLAWGAASDPWPTLQQFSPRLLCNLAYLIIARAFFTFQNIGLTHVPPAPASLFLATESVFGVAFSVALLGETLSQQMMFGVRCFDFLRHRSERILPHVEIPKGVLS